jgi:hypothetical protein
VARRRPREQAFEAIRHCALVQRGVVREQTVQGRGGHPGAIRYRLHTGRATAAGDETTPRRLENDLACFTIGTDTRGRPGGPAFGQF